MRRGIDILATNESRDGRRGRERVRGGGLDLLVTHFSSFVPTTGIHPFRT